MGNLICVWAECVICGVDVLALPGDPAPACAKHGEPQTHDTKGSEQGEPPTGGDTK